MNKEKEAKELAQKIFKFIKHNEIDTNIVPMGEIVAGYFAAQQRLSRDVADTLYHRIAGCRKSAAG